jgi:hypothetical protein
MRIHPRHSVSRPRPTWRRGANLSSLSLAATIALVLASPVRADDSGSLKVFGGAGASTCARWSLERQNFVATAKASDFAWQQMGWLLGYVTSFGQYGPGDGLPVKDMTGSALIAWTDAYCAEHPDDFLAIAASHLTENLSAYAAQNLAAGHAN